MDHKRYIKFGPRLAGQPTFVHVAYYAYNLQLADHLIGTLPNVPTNQIHGSRIVRPEEASQALIKYHHRWGSQNVVLFGKFAALPQRNALTLEISWCNALQLYV